MNSQRFPAFKCREGRIFFWAVSIYFMIWFAVDLGGLKSPLPPSVVMMSGFMPFFMALFFYQVGGFKRSFQSSLFNTGILLTAALIPVLVWVQGLLFR